MGIHRGDSSPPVVLWVAFAAETILIAVGYVRIAPISGSVRLEKLLQQ
jgi:hypothetical protein